MQSRRCWYYDGIVLMLSVSYYCVRIRFSHVVLALCCVGIMLCWHYVVSVCLMYHLESGNLAVPAVGGHRFRFA